MGDMIEIVLCMILRDWITCMAKAGMEFRNITYQALLDLLVILDDTDTSRGQNKERAAGDTYKNKDGYNPGKVKVITPTNTDLESLRKLDPWNATLASYLSQNIMPIKPITLESVRVGNTKKIYVFDEDQMCWNYENNRIM